MRPRPGRRASISGAALASALSALLLATCTSPADTGRAGPSAPSSPASPSVGETTRNAVRISSPPDGTLLVRGRYPEVASRCVDAEQPRLTGRFPGALAVRRADDGTLSLTVTLPFERYLEGIAEVPSSWPKAALNAQAVAARSYALATTGWSGQEGATLDEPICATTDCQVYRGIPVPRDPSHRRWVNAVRRTAGRILVHEGRPATTVYFSTSNGRTYGNDEVFGSAPLPYLRPVPERDDGASPTSRWSVRLPFADLRRILAAGDLWPRGRTISDARTREGAVVLRGGGTSRTIDTGDLRDAVNRWAPCLLPGRYPPGSPKGGTLPITIPSRWLGVSPARRALLVTGRGWGHGVGMVQWGAYGKARRGASAGDILAYYYGGLRPVPYPQPGLIHVRVATGLRRLTVAASAPGAEVGGRTFEGRAIVLTGGDTIEVEG